MRFLLRYALFAMLLLPATSSAQTRPDRWQLTMDNDEIIWDIRLVKLEGDTLTYRQADSLKAVSAGKVREMRLLVPSEMQLGTAGAAYGALTGADDVVFDMTLLDFAERLRTVQQVLLKYPPQQGTPGP